MIYISHIASEKLKKYLISQGHEIEEILPEPNLGAGVSSHPDLLMCKTGVSAEAPCVFADRSLLRPDYPGDALYCAVFLGRYMIHRLDISAPELMRCAEERGLRLINVRQGYTKCSCAVVSENALITADPGIAEALEKTDVDVLRISPGHVALPGFRFGFIGGASGLVGGELLFNGDLSAHPDFERIVLFSEKHGVCVKYFPGTPLTDTGSVIEVL